MKNEDNLFESFLLVSVNPAYRASVREAAHSVTQTKDKYSAITNPTLSDINWPHKGSLRFTRAIDGQRFEVVNRKRGWVCRKVKGAA